MEVVSKLFKTKMTVFDIEREEDRLVLVSDPSDWMASKAYIDAQELGGLIKFIFRWSVISYILMFPFFFIRSFIKNNMDDLPRVFRISNIAAFILLIMLVFMGHRYTYLHPRISSFIFLIFSFLFLISSWVTEKRIYAYPAILLITLSYYLLFGFKANTQPLFSLPIILLFYLSGRYLDKRGVDLAPSFYRGIYWITLYFTYYMILDIRGYLGLFGSIPLYGYAFYYLLRFREKERLRHGYLGLSYFALGYLLMLYWAGIGEKGIYLALLAAFMVLSGERLHGKRYDLRMVSPFYTVGIILGLISFIYSVRDIMIFELNLVIIGFAFLLMKVMIDRKETRDEAGERWTANIFFTIGHITAIIWGIIYLFSGFPYEPVDLIVSFMYTLAYLGVGYLYGREYLLRYRVEYGYIGGVFYSIFTYGLLRFFDLGFYLGALFLFLWLYAGYRSGKDMLMDSMNEAGAYLIGVGLVLILRDGGYGYLDINLMIGLGLVVYLLGYTYFGRRISMVYMLFVLFGGLIYEVLSISGVLGRISFGLVYLGAGMVMMVLAVRLYKAGRDWYRGYYFGWGLYSLISLYSVLPYRDIFLYFLSIIGASFIISSNFMEKGVLYEDN